MKSVKIRPLFVFYFLATTVGLFVGGAQAQTYQPWPGNQQNTQAQMAQFITELRQLVRRAESDRAADPQFLSDLKKLADKYQAGAGTGAQSSGRVFYDDFADGEFYTNPVWKVSAGAWSVDRSGKNIGLVSKVGRPLDLNNVLGAILTPQGSTQAQYASIYSQVRIPGSFLLRMKVTSKDKFGALNVSPYQGASAQNSYRLVYRPGGGFDIQLVRGSNAQTLASSGAVNLEDGKLHEVLWARDNYGRMSLSLDNRQILQLSDLSLNGAFDGILLINSGGSYWLRSMEISGN